MLPPPTLAPNPNTAPAGTLQGGVLTLDLEAIESRWHRDGGAVPGSPVVAFAERGHEPLIPGPLIRVPAGTLVRVSLHNTLARPVTFFLPTSPTTDDSVAVAAGATGTVEVRAATPGNYLYRATVASISSQRLRIHGALTGAMVVDTAGPPRPARDRVMVILMTPDSTVMADLDQGLRRTTGQVAFTINGRSWPHTERLAATVGDTLHWRVINADFDTHPMHLHGFYFRVDDFTGLFAERDGQGDRGRMVVTERMSGWSAMSMTWVAERAGNWLFHCHFAIHLEPPKARAGAAAAPPEDDEHAAHANHALTTMVGLVLAITVTPREGARPVAAARPARRLRLVAVSDAVPPDTQPSWHFVIEEGGRRTAAPAGISPTLYLRRKEPVAITVVNRLPVATAVHWHGLELESYYDGVAGFSGSADRLAPMIAPGDSFVAQFTPPRAGTFMYHSHMDDVKQHAAGLVGALIVQDGPAAARPDDHAFFLKGVRGRTDFGSPLEFGGRMPADTLVLHAGRPARLRFMSLATANPNTMIAVTTRLDSAAQLANDTMLVQWVPVAKDGADLPPGSRTSRVARQIVSMGETYDFELTPARAGELLRIEVRTGTIGTLLARVPVKVE